MSEVRVRFADRVLSDPLYENPVDRFQARARRRNWIILAIIAIVTVVIVWRSMS